VQARKVVPQILPGRFLSFAMLKSSGLLTSTSHSFSAALLGSTASHKAYVLRSRRVLTNPGCIIITTTILSFRSMAILLKMLFRAAFNARYAWDPPVELSPILLTRLDMSLMRGLFNFSRFGRRAWVRSVESRPSGGGSWLLASLLLYYI
jgi:hypothetical protein